MDRSVTDESLINETRVWHNKIIALNFDVILSLYNSVFMYTDRIQSYGLPKGLDMDEDYLLLRCFWAKHTASRCKRKD